jgi:hypothetical protein
MASKSDLRLVELTVSGFQAFRKTSTIPISPITLIYGPNSAGKSAIHDALVLINRFYTGGQNTKWPFIDASSRRYVLADDWHRESDEKYSVDPLVLSVVFECPDYQIFDPQLVTNQYLPFESLNLEFGAKSIIKATVEFEGPWDRTKVHTSFELNGFPLYKFSEGQRAAIKIDHPAFGKQGAKLPKCSLGRNGLSPVLMGGWADLCGDVRMSGPHHLSWEDLAKRLIPSDKAPSNPHIWYESLVEFCFFHNLIADKLARLTSEACSCEIVEASRNIPNSKELTFALTIDCEVADPANLNMQLRGDMRYFPVASSAAASAIKNSGKSSRSKRLSDNGILAKNINQSLADHLYTDRGYRLDVELTKLSPDSQTKLTRDRMPAWLATLCLRDSAGRRHAFTDVGSGLGYVLPAIVALCTSRQCFVQQPELHLHPALQTSLGDALIESTKAGQVLFIETHSEHILLRIMKRIRQTNSDALRAGAYQIDPENVSIVYCEPNPDGTTQVITLRLNLEGEFIGRWPKGFFAERDRELFDE